MENKLKQNIIVTALRATPVSCEAEGTFGRHRETSSDDTGDASDGPPHHHPPHSDNITQ